MATTVTWPTKVINVFRADMNLIQAVPTEIRELDINTFRLELKALEAGPDGMSFIDTHRHNPPVSVGGVTLARVVEIINGYTVTFEDGQYAVNLLGANSNIGDVVNVNQVSVRSANSAGLTFSKEVEDQSFTDARVWINTENGLPGTQFPQGTPGFPVNNIQDAASIIANRNLPFRLHTHGLLTLSSPDTLADYDILSDSGTQSIINLGNVDIDDANITNVKISGSPIGRFTANNCLIISSLNNFTGRLLHCGLGGTVSLSTTGGPSHTFIDCHSHISSGVTIDCNNTTPLNVEVKQFSGLITISNLTAAGTKVSIDLTSGHVILDASCTGGSISIRGVGHLTDNSAGSVLTLLGFSSGASGLNPTESAQLAQIDILRKLMQNRMETNPTTGVLTIFDDDNTTVFLQGNIYEDVLAAQAYRGRGLERRNKLV